MAATPNSLTPAAGEPPTAVVPEAPDLAVVPAEPRRSPRNLKWKLIVDHQMCDDDPAEKQAGIKIFGLDADTGIQDCSAHMWRNILKKCGHLVEGDRKVLQQEFEAMKVLSTERAGVEAVQLWDQRWMKKAPAAMEYFRSKARTFSWMRAQCGPGNDTDNNPLESTNAVQKTDQGWIRLDITNFGDQLVEWLEEQSFRDYCFSGFLNDKVVSLAVVKAAQELKEDKWLLLSPKLAGQADKSGPKDSFALPLALTLSEVPENEIAKGVPSVRSWLKQYREDFLGLYFHGTVPKSHKKK